MSDQPSEPPPCATFAETLTALEQVVAELVERAPQGDLEALAPLLARLEELLAAAQAAAPQDLLRHGQRLGRIVRQHRRLCLMVAEMRHQAAEALSQMTRSKGPLRAYGAAGA